MAVSTKDLLLKLFSGGEARQVRASQTLFREGEQGNSAFVVLEGELEITIRGITMERVGPGGIVGEMAFVDDSPRAASVSALLDSKVAEVPAARFDEIVRKDPAFARVLLSIVAERLRKMNRYL
ncbi:MAG: cyclic nucleotide-binding domain-containing protein [Anaeromyxobacter sp.]